jgi:hypothetical protein
MNAKIFVLAGAGVVFLGLACFTFFWLRQAAAETEASHKALEAESNCAFQVDKAKEIVQDLDRSRGTETRVVETKYHYNQILHSCLVEVSSYQHESSGVTMKTLIDPGAVSAVLWSITGSPEAPERRCFGADSMPLDCAKADQRWSAYMTQ